MSLNTDVRMSISYVDWRGLFFGGCLPFSTANEYITLHIRSEATPLW